MAHLDDGWGDPLDNKESGMIRVVSKNICGIKLIKNNQKEIYLKNWIKLREIDILGVQEVNVNWSRMEQEDRALSRMKSMNWTYITGATSHNKHEKRHKFQYGGTMSLTFEEVAQRTSTTGADPTGLGRWSWVKIDNKKFSVRVVTVYNPHRVQDPRKIRSVYMQQRKYWLSKNNDMCPLILLRVQLLRQLKIWKQKNEKIILLIDMNNDVRYSNFSKELNEIGLISPIRHKFGNEAPPTQELGSRPIDDIFISSDLVVHKCGYAAFGDGPGDHRALFLDIPEEQILSDDKFVIKRKEVRRLNSTIPSVVKKFNDLFEAQLERNHVEKRVFNMQDLIQFPAPSFIINNYDKLDRFQYEAFKYSNKRCRKLRMGAVDYVPEEIQIFGKTINFWNLVKRRKLGCRIGYRRIVNLAKSLNIENPLEFSMVSIQLNLSTA